MCIGSTLFLHFCQELAEKVILKDFGGECQRIALCFAIECDVELQMLATVIPGADL